MRHDTIFYERYVYRMQFTSFFAVVVVVARIIPCSAAKKSQHTAHGWQVKDIETH